MTIQELVIGHFEGTLGAAESAELDRLLASSPEAKAAFDRQQAIEETMAEDAEALVAPSALREVTLAAALGTAVQTIGGGLSAFFTTKIAATLGGVVAGGLIIGGVVLSNDDDGTGDPAAMMPPGVEQTIENSPNDDVMSSPIGVGESQSGSSAESDNANGMRRESNSNVAGADPNRNPSRSAVSNSDGELNDPFENNSGDPLGGGKPNDIVNIEGETVIDDSANDR